MEKQNRRSFIKRAALTGITALSLPEIVKAAVPAASKKITLSESEVILFQGDSITDAGRNRDANDFNNPKALGSGYAMLASAELLNEKPHLDLKIYNKGISGNKVYQLAERWEKDALALSPGTLSILIGVNDYWHTKTNQYAGTVDTYVNDFRALLERTRKALPQVKLIIGEPFAVPGIRAVDASWYPDFDAYRAAAKTIAEEFDAVFIPYQEVFNKATRLAPGVYWTHDGVHPSLAGAQLMAEAWLRTIR